MPSLRASHAVRSCWRLALALALAASLTPPDALADNTADEANLRFRRGVEAYRGRRFEEALAEFFHSNRLVKNRNVIMNIARCYEQLRQYDEAYRYYDDVLAENPPEEDRRVAEESRARLAPRVALLRVESDPPGADVFIERMDLGQRGTTPRTLALPEGEAVMLLSMPGYRVASAKARLVTGRTATVKLPLEFIWAKARLSGIEGAEVRVDTTEGGAAAVIPSVLKLKPGKHILNVTAARYLPIQVPVEIQGDREEPISVTLQPLPEPTGNIMVTANYDGALVTVDGKEAGFTPAIISLPVGAHEVAVSMSEMRPFAQRVEVTANENAGVKATLHYAGATTTAASKTETTVDEVPASITVISREEILAFGYTTLADALRAVRGMWISSGRTYDYLGVRGFSPPGDYNERFLVLFDGHPMNEIFSGQAFIGWEGNVDLNEIERIEVVRGPVSSLFGSAAFFGVINVVPRHHLGDKQVEGELGTGSLGLARGRATAGIDAGEARGLVTVAGVRSADDGIFVAPVDSTTEALTRRSVAENAYNGTARGSYKGFSVLASLNSRTRSHLWLTSGQPTSGQPTLATQYLNSVRDQRGFVEARYDANSSAAGDFAARLYYDALRYTNDTTHDDGRITWTKGTADWAGLEVRWRSPEVLKQRLTLGAEVQSQLRILQQNAESPSPGEAPQIGLDDLRSFNVLSGYLVDELRLGDALLVNFSVRADEYFNSFGLTVNPRLAFISRIVPGGVSKLMGGKSFRAPTAYERFYCDPLRDPTTGQLTGQYGTSRPSPNLGPETVYTAELEHTQELARNLRATGSIYLNSLRGLVYTTYLPIPGTEDSNAATVNANGSVRTQGAELELRWQPSKWSMISVAYWYQQIVAQITDPTTGQHDTEQETRLKANIPPHAAAVRASIPIYAPLLIGSIEGVYNAARPQEDGTSPKGELFYLNIGLSGELVGHGFRYFAGVENLLNQRPAYPATLDVHGLSPQGITLLAQVAASF